MILKIYNNKLSFIRMFTILVFLFFFHPNLFAGNYRDKTDIFDPLFFNTEYNPGINNRLKRIPRIDAAKAFWLFKSGKLILIDTHEHLKEGDKSPIVGAITLSYRKIPRVKIKVPKNRIVACFCH